MQVRRRLKIRQDVKKDLLHMLFLSYYLGLDVMEQLITCIAALASKPRRAINLKHLQIHVLIC